LQAGGGKIQPGLAEAVTEMCKMSSSGSTKGEITKVSSDMSKHHELKWGKGSNA